MRPPVKRIVHFHVYETIYQLLANYDFFDYALFQRWFLLRSVWRYAEPLVRFS